MNPADFGPRLRELRTARELTRRALAEATGLTEDGIYKLETAAREPSWSTVLALAEALELSSLDEFTRPAPSGRRRESRS